jgi:biotin operon repressor
MSRQEAKRLVRELRELGLAVDATGSGHYRVDTDQGPVFLPSSPSCSRAMQNARAELRRHGVDIR